MKKTPRFFCDNCGAEVDRNVKSCPRCGRFFASVRCPACGFTGDESAFANGCPSCGYSARSAAGRPPLRKKKSSPSLPAWVYVFSIFALLFVCVIMFFAVMR